MTLSKMKTSASIALISFGLFSTSLVHAYSGNQLIPSGETANTYLYQFDIMDIDAEDAKAQFIDGIEAMLALKGETDEAAVAYFNPELTMVNVVDRSIVSYALSKGYIEMNTVHSLYQPMTSTDANLFMIKGLNLPDSATLESANISSLSGSSLTNETFKKKVVEAMFAVNPNTGQATIRKMLQDGSVSLTPYTYSSSEAYLKLHKPLLEPSTDSVLIDNTALKSAICEAIDWQLNKTVSMDEPIEKSDLFFIEELVINEDLSSFEGIEHLPNLKKLHLNKTTSSLKGLEHAANLEALYINLTPLKPNEKDSTFSLEPLQHMSNLKELGIIGTRYSGRMTKKELKYQYPSAKDTHVLNKMTKMQELQLNNLSLEALDFTKDMYDLYGLDIAYNNISSISLLKDKIMLIDVVLNNNPISSIDSLNNCIELLSLSADNLKLNSISGLTKLQKLRYLNIEGNQIKAIDIVEKMPSLKEVQIDGNPIKLEDLTPYFDIVEGHPFGDREFLKSPYTFLNPALEPEIRTYLGKASGAITYYDLYCVEILDLSNKGITDISDLRNLRNLTYLDLRNNEVDNFSPLSGLDDLNYLYLEGNPSKNYGSLISIYGTLYTRDFSIPYTPAPSSQELLLSQDVYTVDDLDNVITLSLNNMNQDICFNILNPKLRNLNYILRRSDILKSDYCILVKAIESQRPGEYTMIVKHESTPTTGIYTSDGVKKIEWYLNNEEDEPPANTIQNLGKWIERLEKKEYGRWKDPSGSVHPSIASMAKKITKGKTSDLDKVKAVHDWLAKNISYDVEHLNDTENIVYPLEESLAQREGVCADYSFLGSHMLNSVGVEAYVISGYSGGSSWTKNSDYTVLRTIALFYNPYLEEQEDLDTTGHAWNVALVDGRWLEFDTTWDSGFVNFERDKFTHYFRTEYFDNSANIRNDHTYGSILGKELSLFKKMTLKLGHDDNLAISQLLNKKLFEDYYTIFDSVEINSVISTNQPEYTQIYGFIKDGVHYAIATAFSDQASMSSAYLLKKENKQWSIIKEESLPSESFLLDAEILVFNLFVDAMKNY